MGPGGHATVPAGLGGSWPGWRRGAPVAPSRRPRAADANHLIGGHVRLNRNRHPRASAEIFGL